MAITVRRAVLADRTKMRALLVTKVGGVSPYEEMVADFGEAALYSAADLLALVQSGDMQVAVAYDGTTLRGFNLFVHATDGLGALGVPDVLDAWQSTYTVTDKTLTVAERVAVAGAMYRSACAAVAPDVYIYGLVKTPGRLDTLLSDRGFASVPADINGVACNCYYGTAGDGLVKL